MTRARATERTELAPYLDALTAMGIQAVSVRRPGGWGRADAAGAWLQLRGPWGKTVWPCELVERVERPTLGAIIDRMKRLRAQASRALLLTEHVTPPLAEELRKHDVAFIDAAGNAFLQDKGIYVWVTHHARRQTAKEGRRAIHGAGLKLIFVLLRAQVHETNLRTLAGAAGIALGGTTRILDELERRGWIRRTPGGIEVHDATAMLNRWDEGYADTLRPKLALKAYRQKPGTELDTLTEAIAAADLEGKVLLGGELGAALLTRNLRPATATLHLDGIEATDVARELDLVPDPRGHVWLVRAFGQVSRATTTGPGGVALADPLLVRGELLLHLDDRLRAIAETLRTDHIVRRWA
jgi:hypothetical protein